MVAKIGPARRGYVDGDPHGDGDDEESEHLRELWLCGWGSRDGGGGGGGEGTDFACEGECHGEDERGEEKGGVG